MCSAMEVDLSALSRQIESLSKHSPEELPKVLSPNAASELRRNLSRLSVALESHGDIVDRIVYSVSTIHTKSTCLHEFTVPMLMRGLD